ncbi:MAG: MYXO-CTERM sorting domain-containing protein, partial [Polyangiales bacterium]
NEPGGGTGGVGGVGGTGGTGGTSGTDGSSGCGSCTVGSSDASGSLLLSLGVLSVLLWRRRRSSQS